MNLRNTLKQQLLAVADPDEQIVIKRVAAGLRKQIKKRGAEETPFLTLQEHQVMSAFLLTLRAERQLLTMAQHPEQANQKQAEPANQKQAEPKGRAGKSPEDAAFDHWQKASEALKEAMDNLEERLGKEPETKPMGIADAFAPLIRAKRAMLERAVREATIKPSAPTSGCAPGDDHTQGDKAWPSLAPPSDAEMLGFEPSPPPNADSGPLSEGVAREGVPEMCGVG